MQGQQLLNVVRDPLLDTVKHTESCCTRRSRRSVIIFDSGEKRNEASQIQHGILGADGKRSQDQLLGQALGLSGMMG